MAGDDRLPSNPGQQPHLLVRKTRLTMNPSTARRPRLFGPLPGDSPRQLLLANKKAEPPEFEIGFSRTYSQLYRRLSLFVRSSATAIWTRVISERRSVPRPIFLYQSKLEFLCADRPLFLYQSRLKFLGINSPIRLMSCGFRALQRLNEEALECAPHRCISLFCRTPV